jgi:Type VI secretion system/phage-baseplate injector OB domain
MNWRFWKPKNTVHSVARQLAAGLRDGSIVLDEPLEDEPPLDSGNDNGPWYAYGVFSGEVVEGNDPQGEGRIHVTLYYSTDAGSRQLKTWARSVATADAHGNWQVSMKCPPGVKVAVMFEKGDLRLPRVVGSILNRGDRNLVYRLNVSSEASNDEILETVKKCVVGAERQGRQFGERGVAIEAFHVEASTLEVALRRKRGGMPPAPV